MLFHHLLKLASTAWNLYSHVDCSCAPCRHPACDVPHSVIRTARDMSHGLTWTARDMSHSVIWTARDVSHGLIGEGLLGQHVR